MLGIGLWELAAIVVVLFIFLKPEDIPKALRALGRLYGRFTAMTGGFTRAVEEGMREAEREERERLRAQARESASPADPATAAIQPPRESPADDEPADSSGKE